MRDLCCQIFSVIDIFFPSWFLTAVFMADTVGNKSNKHKLNGSDQCYCFKHIQVLHFSSC